MIQKTNHFPYGKGLFKIYRLLKKIPGGISIIEYDFLLPAPKSFSFHLVRDRSRYSGLQYSHFLRKFQGSYAMYYKSKHKDLILIKRLPIFEGRFKAKPLLTEDYLIKCKTYVNFNAQKHELVENMKFWPYSSVHSFLDMGIPKISKIKLVGDLNGTENLKDCFDDGFEY